MHKRWFCACRDGFLDYKELETLAHRTAGTLTAEDYIALCGTHACTLLDIVLYY